MLLNLTCGAGWDVCVMNLDGFLCFFCLLVLNAAISQFKNCRMFKYSKCCCLRTFFISGWGLAGKNESSAGQLCATQHSMACTAHRFQSSSWNWKPLAASSILQEGPLTHIVYQAINLKWAVIATYHQLPGESPKYKLQTREGLRLANNPISAPTWLSFRSNNCSAGCVLFPLD